MVLLSDCVLATPVDLLTAHVVVVVCTHTNKDMSNWCDVAFQRSVGLEMLCQQSEIPDLTVPSTGTPRPGQLAASIKCFCELK